MRDKAIKAIKEEKLFSSYLGTSPTIIKFIHKPIPTYLQSLLVLWENI